jgi:hypothetical protein
MSAKSRKEQKEEEEFKEMWRTVVSEMTPKEVEEYAASLPLETHINTAIRLGISNPQKYGDSLGVMRAMHKLITGQTVIGTLTEEKQEIDKYSGSTYAQSVSKKRKTGPTLKVFDDAELEEKYQQQNMTEYERKRLALSGPEPAFPVFLNQTDVVLPPTIAVLAPQRPTATRKRDASVLEKTSNSRAGRKVQTKKPVPLTEMLSENKIQEFIASALPVQTKVYQPLIRPQKPKMPTNLTELLETFKSAFLAPLDMNALDYSMIRLLINVLNSEKTFERLPQVVDGAILDVRNRLEQAKKFVTEMKAQKKPIPPVVTNFGNFYQDSYLPQLLKYRKTLTTLLDSDYFEDIRLFLKKIGQSPLTGECLSYLFNIYAAKVSIADWEYQIFLKRGNLTKEDSALAKQKMDDAKKHIEEQTKKFQSSACYTRVPNFAE